MKILGIAGYSGCGKTTLIEKLLPLLNAAGLTVSVVKQSHHDIAFDVEGKDSWRHRQAGAKETLLTSPHRWMLAGELHGAPEPTLDSHLARLSPCDLVLVEGYKHAALPKLEVWRAANGKPWLYPDDGHFIATIADTQPDCPLPWLDLNQPASIATFILEWLGACRTLVVDSENRPQQGDLSTGASRTSTNVHSFTLLSQQNQDG